MKYKQVFSYYRYNYQTGQLDEYIQEGTKFEYKLTPQPLIEATLKLINNKTGEVQKYEFILPEKESQEFDKLKSDKERKQYLSEYAKRTGLLDKLQHKLNDPELNNSKE